MQALPSFPEGCGREAQQPCCLEGPLWQLLSRGIFWDAPSTSIFHIPIELKQQSCLFCKNTVLLLASYLQYEAFPTSGMPGAIGQGYFFWSLVQFTLTMKEGSLKRQLKKSLIPCLGWFGTAGHWVCCASVSPLCKCSWFSQSSAGKNPHQHHQLHQNLPTVSSRPQRLTIFFYEDKARFRNCFTGCISLCGTPKVS